MPDLLQNALIYVGSFVVVLSLVVFVHEFGHFQVGRWCGIAVKSFSIGFGSEWFGWTDKHGTRWKISNIPLGGFVSWVDDSDPTSTRPATEEAQELSIEEARRRGHFRAQPVWKRAAATAAGPVANFMFSIVAFGTLALVVGGDATDINSVPARIGGVVDNSAAAQAGLRVGDIVRAADETPIGSFMDLQRQVAGAAGRPLQLTVERDGTMVTIAATPGVREAGGQSVGVLGVSGPLVLEAERVIVRYGPVEAVGVGAQRTWDVVAQTGAYIGAIFAGRESGDQIAGPLGILNVSGQVATTALEGSDDAPGGPIGMLVLSLLGLAAMLSVAVGIVNLLPIPILDGGHLVFYAIEAVRGGRPLPAAAQEWAYRAGFAVMAGLFLFATWNDITRHLIGSQG